MSSRFYHLDILEQKHMSTVNQSPENRIIILGSVIFQEKQQNIAKCVNYGVCKCFTSSSQKPMITVKTLKLFRSIIFSFSCETFSFEEKENLFLLLELVFLLWIDQF